MKYTPKEPATNVNVSEVSPLREFTGLVCILIAMIVAGYVVLGMLVDVVALKISPGTEASLARGFSKYFDDNKEFSKEQERIQRLVDSLASFLPKSEYQFKVHISSAGEINALALPGGHIVIFKGLLDQIESENSLAMVLGHELGHFSHRDQLRGLGRGLVIIFLVTSLLGGESSFGEFTANLLITTQLKFSRDQERNADKVGLELVNAHYGHVTGATEFFEQIAKKGEEPFFAFMASHPLSSERIQTLKDLALERGYKVGKKLSW